MASSNNFFFDIKSTKIDKSNTNIKSTKIDKSNTRIPKCTHFCTFWGEREGSVIHNRNIPKFIFVIYLGIRRKFFLGAKTRPRQDQDKTKTRQDPMTSRYENIDCPNRLSLTVSKMTIFAPFWGSVIPQLKDTPFFVWHKQVKLLFRSMPQGTALKVE